MSKAPNTWFHYDHPEHGKIEVSAHVDKKGKTKIHSVGAIGDIHVHPKHDAGMSDDHINAMSSHASKLGEGNHMKKSEREVAIAILDKVQELYKSRNSAHVVEQGADCMPAEECDPKEDRVKENDAETSESDMVDTDDEKDKKKKKDENRTERYEDNRHPEARGEKDSGGSDSEMKKTEKPLVAFLRKREEKIKGNA